MAKTEKIISVSRRTDIPAFYSEWFVNRVRAGYCFYPNPLYPNKFYKVSLLKEDVLGFVFWTRHAAPLMKYLVDLDKAGFVYYFQYTIVGYPRSLDPKSPSLETSIKTMCQLSEQIGEDRVVWRYDPIVLNHELSLSWHQKNFTKIADAIGGATRRLVVSVVDPYRKTQQRVSRAESEVLYEPSAYRELLSWISSEGSARNLCVQTCAEPSVEIPGIVSGSCVDSRLLYMLRRRPLPAKVRQHKQREGCLCHQSVDIGVNDTCGFGCQYCYATKNHDRAAEMVTKHNSEWPCITQDVPEDKPVTDSQQTLGF